MYTWILHSFNAISRPISLDSSFIVLTILFAALFLVFCLLALCRCWCFWCFCFCFCFCCWCCLLHRLQKTFVLWFVRWFVHTNTKTHRTHTKCAHWLWLRCSNTYESTMRFYCLKYYLLEIFIKFYVPFSNCGKTNGLCYIANIHTLLWDKLERCSKKKREKENSCYLP